MALNLWVLHFFDLLCFSAGPWFLDIRVFPRLSRCTVSIRFADTHEKGVRANQQQPLLSPRFILSAVHKTPLLRILSAGLLAMRHGVSHFRHFMLNVLSPRFSTVSCKLSLFFSVLKSQTPHPTAELKLVLNGRTHTARPAAIRQRRLDKGNVFCSFAQ
ncbi:MAG: hypothetical protein Q4G07_11355 [Oscillospiraceae bacterium]|nr:hypothetical protein [Oscillospiraceae bacterium]